MILFGAGLYIGHDYTDKAMTVQINKANDERREVVRQLNEDAEKKEKEHRKAVAGIDEKLTKEAESARVESEALRGDVASGSKRLFVAIERARKCEMSRDTNAASVGDAERAELDDSARQDYYSLRDGIQRKERRLEVCQEILSKLKN
ncbi:MAG: lysis system i-spanin subunit Rz [Hafnia sp.]